MQFALFLAEYLYSTPQQLAKKLRYFCKNPRHVRTHKVMVRIREQVNCALQFIVISSVIDYWTWSRGYFCFLRQNLRSNGQQKRTTCFATLPQKEMKSSVARFTTNVQTCLAINQIVASCVNNKTRELRYTRELRHLMQNKFALGR